MKLQKLMQVLLPLGAAAVGALFCTGTASAAEAEPLPTAAPVATGTTETGQTPTPAEPIATQTVPVQQMYR